jgi:hypothetical protein
MLVCVSYFLTSENLYGYYFKSLGSFKIQINMLFHVFVLEKKKLVLLFFLFANIVLQLFTN